MKLKSIIGSLGNSIFLLILIDSGCKITIIRTILFLLLSLSAIGDTVKAVTVGGVECSEETVKDGSDEVQRPGVGVPNDSVTLSAQAQAFFDFATSTDAADLIRTAGAVPVNE